MAKKVQTRKKNAVPWGAVAFALVITFGLLFWAVFMSWPKKEGGHAAAGGDKPAAQGEPKTPLEGFMDALADERFKPDYPIMQKPCPLHPQEMLDVPVKRLVGERLDIYGDNSFGGVATDLMKIGLGPPKSGERIGEPSTDIQDFDSLVASCPQTGASFSMQDLQRLEGNPAGRDKLVGWDLAAECPALATRPQAQWTVDEQRLARLLTQRRWGASSVELGFTALNGAYSSNFAVYIGRDYRIEGAAWYALAAAYFQQAIDEGSLNGEAQTAVAKMTLAEILRLLGDTTRAGELLAEVKAAGALPEGSAEVLDQMIKLAGEGNSDLARAEVQNVPTPPVGWYLDKMLPAINGQLAVGRQQWGPQGLGASFGQPETILDMICESLGGAAAPPAAETTADSAPEAGAGGE